MREHLRGLCLENLDKVERLLDPENVSFTFAPIMKLRLTTKRNILKHLIDYDTCLNFASEEDLEQYIEDRTNIICGFYED